MEIITSVILYGFIVFVLGMVGKLVYEVQQNKKRENEVDELCATEAEFEAKDRFQKLAGIGQPKNELDPEIWKYVADKVSKEGFPEPDPSIPITTAKVTTISTNFESSDPLSEIPMSRVSKEAKKKMAEIAKEDIKEKLDELSKYDQRFGIEFVEATKTKKKSNSKMPKEIKDAMLNAPILKPKKKSNPKQMDGKVSINPVDGTVIEFKKTRKKKSTK